MDERQQLYAEAIKLIRRLTDDELKILFEAQKKSLLKEESPDGKTV